MGAAAHEPGETVSQAKDRVRRHYRQLRREVDDVPVRSQQIWDRICATDDYRRAGRVVVFDAIVGEPHTAKWKAAMVRDGKRVWVPEDDDLSADADLVIVPGVAFTATGARLGQGGGWYDRYLEALPTGAPRFGVCFEVQLADKLPMEPHDVTMSAVVTEDRLIVIPNI